MLESYPFSVEHNFSKRADAEEFWRMPWQELEVSLGLRNLFSLRTLNVTTLERASELLRHCGFDMSRADHRRHFEQFYGEALFITRHTLLKDDERERLRVPAELLHLEDPRRVLLYASQRGPRRRYKRLWACALLKVMHAIVNLEYSGKLRDLQQAREQIFGRIKELLKTQPSGELVLDDSRNRIQLAAADWKEAKTRTSIILKLLHKPDSMVDEVFDYLGVRFVVPHEHDIPRLLRFLIENDIIIPHQVIGGRTRNSLLNLKTAERLHNLSSDLLSTSTITPQEFNDMCARIPWSVGAADDHSSKRSNAFSSTHYRSIQITVRHLVRTPNPAYMVIDSLSSQLRHYRGMDREDPWLAGLIPPEIARFFPLEIQMMDESSYDVSRFGAASHEQYKASQLKVVRERVLGSMLFFNEEKMTTQEF